MKNKNTATAGKSICSMKVKSVLKIFCFIFTVLLICYFEGKYNFIYSKQPTTIPASMATKRILAADFEIFGRVQGVFFRKNTEDTANKLKVRGWCMNTPEGTVKGQMEGEEVAFNQMKQWLTEKGSPQSKIDRAVFSEPKVLTAYTFESFGIKRSPKSK